jgi:hypothetical protein
MSERLGPEQMKDPAEFLADLVESDRGAAQRRQVARYYLGDTDGSKATHAFIEACGRMIELATRGTES